MIIIIINAELMFIQEASLRKKGFTLIKDDLTLNY